MADALIGLEETHFLVREGDDIVDVCVRIVGTTLDRSVTITLVTSDETATCKLSAVSLGHILKIL